MRILFFLLFLFALTASGFGQAEPGIPASLERRQMQEMLYLQQQGRMSGVKFFASFHREKDVDTPLYKYVGFTEEQREGFYERVEQLREEYSEKVQSFQEGLSRSSTMSPEELAEFEEEFAAGIHLEFELCNDLVAEILTPEQLHRYHEWELATLSQPDEMSVVNAESTISFDGYKALELSEEQQKTLDEIRKEFEPEMRALCMELGALAAEGWEEAKDTTADEIEGKRKRLEEIREKIKQLSARTKARIVGILTPEQAARMEKLQKELPDRLEKLKNDIEEAADPEDDAWKKSWKPGDPIPEGKEPPKQQKPFPFGGP